MMEAVHPDLNIVGDFVLSVRVAETDWTLAPDWTQIREGSWEVILRGNP